MSRDSEQLAALQSKYGPCGGLRAFQEAEYERVFSETLADAEWESSERVRLALDSWFAVHDDDEAMP